FNMKSLFWACFFPNRTHFLKPTARIKINGHVGGSFNLFNESIKYLGVTLMQDLSKIQETNYSKINNMIQRDPLKWSKLVLNFSSRIEIIKMNILCRLLYLFLSLPFKIPEAQFKMWNKQVSRVIWAGKRPRVKFKTLQLDKRNGGLALSSFIEYYYAYEAKWKQIESNVSHIQPQARLGEKERISKIAENTILEETLKIWYEVLKKNTNQKEIVKYWYGPPTMKATSLISSSSLEHKHMELNSLEKKLHDIKNFNRIACITCKIRNSL
uniref:Reverse transcriptase domain-containing protein n=1 Tax=Fundulus heteroclitus TaxID=8078 RepID=A0A3Q2QCD1_FUNHE